MSSLNPNLDTCPVPLEQRPLNEYERLRERPGFAWSTQSEQQYLQRLSIITFFCLGVCLLISIASTPTSGSLEMLTISIYSIAGTITLLMLLYVRVYLGWQYVYDRLMRSTVPYEESGWYDGQIWVKSPEALVQDRLTGTYQLKPILDRLKVSMGVLMSLQIGIISWIFS